MQTLLFVIIYKKIIYCFIYAFTICFKILLNVNAYGISNTIAEI